MNSYDAFGRKYEFSMVQQYAKLIEELKAILAKRREKADNN